MKNLEMKNWLVQTQKGFQKCFVCLDNIYILKGQEGSPFHTKKLHPTSNVWV